MKTMRLFPLELRRLLQSRLTWLMMALTVLSPVLGLVLYKPATSTTMLSMYLANPAIAGGTAGAILFGLLTIFELDRACRSRVDILTDAVVSPLTTALTRLLALLAATVLTVGLTMLVWLPISVGLIGAVFIGIIAVFPGLFGLIAGQSYTGLTLGGTSVMIIVGVALETTQQIESQMMMRHYKGFLE